MRIERALAIVHGIGVRRRRSYRRRAPVLVPAPICYPPSPQPWAWATGNPRERANMVRSHYNIPGLSGEALCNLFNLNVNGLVEIIRGDDWRPQYSGNGQELTPPLPPFPHPNYNHQATYHN